jgi:hypothetical protein
MNFCQPKKNAKNSRRKINNLLSIIIAPGRIHLYKTGYNAKSASILSQLLAMRRNDSQPPSCILNM